jgi:hypothetical protein
MSTSRSRGAPGTEDNDVPVESGDFNRRFRVESFDKAFAHALLQPRLIERLLQSDTRDLEVDIAGDQVTVRSTGLVKGYEHVERQLNLAVAVADLIPRFVEAKWGPSGDRSLGARDGNAWSPSQVASKERNGIARAALVCAFSVVLFPVGIALGHRALVAARRGEASNGQIAAFALSVSYLWFLVAALAFGNWAFHWGL